MNKQKAIDLLGGTVSAAAAAIGVTPSAITQWPDELPSRLVDRVHAALARKHLPAEMLGTEGALPVPTARKERRDAAGRPLIDVNSQPNPQETKDAA